MARKNYVAIPPKPLKTDVLSSDSTFKLRDILWYTGSDGVDVNLSASDFGSDNVGYGVFEPKTAREEWFTFSSANMATAVTGGLTITARGLNRTSPYGTEASARKHNHESGSIVLLYTNSPAFYDDFANKDNDETVSGKWTFPTGANAPVSGTVYVAPTDDLQFAPKKYADDLAIAGSPAATNGTAGIDKIASTVETIAGTNTDGTYTYVIPVGLTKATSAGVGDSGKLPILNPSGVLATSFFDYVHTWINVQTFTASTLQITTLPSGANDAVNKTYADSRSYLDYGDGSDGDVTISVPTTLTKDMYYNNLVLNADINTAGYRVFWKGTLTRAGSAKIHNNGSVGGNGGNGSGATGGAAGAAGAALAVGTMPGGVAGVVGGAGAGVTNTGATGSAGANASSQTVTVSTSAGTAGGAGASTNNGGTFAGGAGGNGASVTATKAQPRNTVAAFNLYEFITGTIALMKVGGQCGGGGGGGAVANSGTAAGGGGGGSGSSGGFLFVSGKTIDVTGSANLFEAVGGAGGAGGNGVQSATQGAGGGGGGGAGGAGGVIFLRYSVVTGTGSVNTSVLGGAGGAIGSGASNGGATVSVPATAGATGPSGVLVSLTTAFE